MPDSGRVSDRLKMLYPGIDPALVAMHCRRLGARYAAVFSDKDIYMHLSRLETLTQSDPVSLIVERGEGYSMSCTVLAFDYPFEFSLLSGILSSSGMNIVSGDVFTYSNASPERRKNVEPDKNINGTGNASRFDADKHPIGRTMIIDRFMGTVSTYLSESQWESSVREKIRSILLLLETHSLEAITQAKQRVNSWVADSIGSVELVREAALSPLLIDIDEANSDFISIRIVSEDSPFFLYSVSNALALRGVNILRVTIETSGSKIKDEFDVVGRDGKKITDKGTLNRIRLSVLFTKQFTYFLGESPDPYSALLRFEDLVERITSEGESRLIDSLSSPATMRELAKLLGASDFLWEDFIRLNYEHLLPVLSEDHGLSGFDIQPPDVLKDRLDRIIEAAGSIDKKKDALNDFKDTRIFLIDLQHILIENFDFGKLSSRLTALAEIIINKSFEIHFERLREQYGLPKTIAGQTARHAIFGLGKFGGMALGYASDIEILVVYGDNGKTDGPVSISNSEFFEILVREATLFIEAKREGIFKVDLRLRPFGESGPLAVSLEQFCRYYAKDGSAHSFERLSMVRLRALGGDLILGRQIERIRDELIYLSQSISIPDLMSVRNKQLAEKSEKGKLNVKFGRGALVDLEYAVQILQIKFGSTFENLKTPIMADALRALSKANILSPDEAAGLIDTYDFFRKLINGLRMLRGSATDLSLPETGSDEYAHLARRMGYERSGSLSSLKQLEVDFNTTSAKIRVFIDRHFGNDSLIGPAVSSITDIILFREIPQDRTKEILRNAGFKNESRAYVNIRRMADGCNLPELYAKLSVLAFDIMKQTPDSDMALNNWERYVSVLPLSGILPSNVVVESARRHYESLLSQPMKLRILLRIFSVSQFLSDTLIRYPAFLDSVIVPETINKNKTRDDYMAGFDELVEHGKSGVNWLDRIRRYRKREMLRTATRDICLGISLPDITAEISSLAEAVIQTALDQIQRETDYPIGKDFVILAFGKLGGRELNYSSDIDIVGIYKTVTDAGFEEVCRKTLEKLITALSSHTEEGYAYRVDLRLRPFGVSGSLVTSYENMLDYYRTEADIREVQALIKLRAVAGDIVLGEKLVADCRKILCEARDKGIVFESITRNLKEFERRAASHHLSTLDIKNGAGGIRSIEFLIQGLQLANAALYNGVVDGNTLVSLDLLARYGITDDKDAGILKDNYTYFRRLEHFLQLFEDQQTHTLPTSPDELASLVRRVEAKEMSNEMFIKNLKKRLEDVEGVRRKYIGM